MRGLLLAISSIAEISFKESRAWLEDLVCKTRSLWTVATDRFVLELSTVWFRRKANLEGFTYNFLMKLSLEDS